ncbi:5'-3' exonuclease [Abyssicoccus albus]|uniref:5'-3' exonuclease n=1 Tax=Abyssicoccus albus TaxID=1817405 RepID=A0A3N5BJF7_9BACL|nr:5'-3' exonuclease [Abyssicoccus albus]RPF57996.1 5'-3' exonuclease [Abyssicoccus albus]
MVEPKEKVLIIDGMALLFRHFFATSINKHFMPNQDGIPTNGIQGFLRHTFYLIKETNTPNVIITWDKGQYTFRNDLHEDYKANRQPPPSELIPQFDLVQKISEEIGFCNIGVEGYEADDVIGSLAKYLSYDFKVIAVSGDKDLLQILDKDIELWLIKKGFTEYNIYNKERFIQKYNIQPNQFVDVKALMGDTSDGYKGVSGIGEKTALKLIQTHHSISNLLENLESLTKGQKQKIEDDMDSLTLSNKLAKIYTEVPLVINDIINDMRLTQTEQQLIEVLDAHTLTITKKYYQSLYQ